MFSAAKIQKVLESYTDLKIIFYFCNQIRKSFLQKRRGIGILKLISDKIPHIPRSDTLESTPPGSI